MPTHQCCACKSSTLLDNEAIHHIAMAAGLIDNALRQYSRHVRTQPHQDQPWAGLSTLLEVLPTILDSKLDGISQGAGLAKSIEKNWLGCFESLCLTCGLMFLPDDELPD
ncbi:MAG: hypothetical protein CMK77_06375 [Pseudomonadales bacterium]|nr:hypothetical protein [Pseudomonadales bacterium]|tara:strand:- start:5158 stop:5487 length:330 start_codon:yes stop_codon:yes gene_type:complete